MELIEILISLFSYGFEVGDKVLMKSSENDNAQHVAIVRSLKAHVDGNVMAEVRLYYRPEDTVGGRRPFHGSRELFLTNHFDTQRADTILHKCFVHHFLHYIKLKEVVGPHDYFSRFDYNTDTLWFSPDSVEVYVLQFTFAFDRFNHLFALKFPINVL